ncbi:MAG: nucleotidyltransferase domain-containing protein [Actinomycetota bacterium]
MEIDEEPLRGLYVELIVLFGSRARGDAGPSSDTDVGVLFSAGKPHGIDEIEKVRAALGGGDFLDLVCLNTADPLLLRLAAEEGIAQFQAHPGAIEEFRLRAHKRYMDTAKFRRLEAETLRARHG